MQESPAPLPAVGIDVGFSHLAVLSDGRKIDNPRFMRKAQKRIKRASRALSRKKKGSVNRKRCRRALARKHGKIARQRKNYFQQTVRGLVDAHSGFAVESLSLKGMARTRMAKSLYDAGIGMFLKLLKGAAQAAGRDWYEHGRYQRSTGVCLDCGLVGERLPLHIREWTCSGCAAVHDRDIAAARVLLSASQCDVALSALQSNVAKSKRQDNKLTTAMPLQRVGQGLSEPTVRKERSKRGFAAWRNGVAIVAKRPEGTSVPDGSRGSPAKVSETKQRMKQYA